MAKNYLKEIIISVVGIAVGYWICILSKKYSNLTIANEVAIEVNPFEIFTLIATILLAIYVTRSLNKSNEKEKGEKELLISYLKELKTTISSKTAKILEQDKIDSPETNAQLKILRQKVDTIIKLGEEFKFIDSNDKTSKQLQEYIKDLWEILTDCPEKTNIKASAAIKEGLEKLRLTQVNKAESKVISLEKVIFQLIMKVNQK